MAKSAPPGATTEERVHSTIVVEDEALRAGFTQIPNLVLRRRSLTPGAKLTYMVLLSYAWQAGSCFPGHDRMAFDMGVSRRSIITYLKELQDQGLIRVQRRGLGLTNVYRIIELAQVPPDPRSAKSAHQEVQKTTHPEVPDLRTKKYSDEEDSERIHPSNIRRGETSEAKDEDHPEAQKAISQDPVPREPHRPSMTAQKRRREGFVRAGDVLAARDGNADPRAATTPQKPYPEERQRILSSIQDLARELGDEAPLASSVSRAYNLWEQSGIPIEAFSTFLYEARSRTWESTASITKRRQPHNDDGREIYGPSKNRMAYFFSVLEELVDRHAPGKGAQAQTVTSTNLQPALPTPALLPSPDPRAAIERYIETTAKAFGDEAPLTSSVTRALHLYERSGVPLARFLASLFEARSLTEEYTANITKRQQGREGPFGPELNRMAYFFSVLEQVAKRPDPGRGRRAP